MSENLTKTQRWYSKKTSEEKKEWYLKHKETGKLSKASRKARAKEFVTAYKETHHCYHCGESNPIVLDFHHQDADDKVKAIAQMVCYGATDEKLIEEISKCIVLCANCHRIEHYNLKQKS